MTFIITLISLIIERFFHWGHLRSWNWFNKYQRWLSATRITNWSSYLLLAICVLPLAVIVGLIDIILDGWFFGIFKIIFGVGVLLYCFGPENLWAQSFGVLSDINKEDPRVAIERGQKTFDIPTPSNSQAFHKSLTSAIFVEAHQRIFAVIFWFVILGPAGAILYRSITMCSKQSELGLTQAATEVKRILDWIPIRLFTFLFALGGHFTEVFAVWKKDAKSDWNGNDKLLADCGVAALDRKGNSLPEDGEAEKSAVELLDRVFVMSLVLLAMIVLMV